MKYANPRHEEEFKFIADLIWRGHQSNSSRYDLNEKRWFNPPLFANADEKEAFIKKMELLYGPIPDFSEDLCEKVQKASIDVKFHIGWSDPYDYGRSDYGPERFFRNVRRVVLEKFYPGKSNFDKIKQYFKESR